MAEKKRLVLFWVLSGGLVFTLAIGILYSYAAFTPTGFEQVQLQLTESRGKTNALVRPRFESAGPVNTVGTTQTAEVGLIDFIDHYNYLRATSPKLGGSYVFNGPAFFSWETPINAFTSWLPSSFVPAGGALWPTLDPVYQNNQLRMVATILSPTPLPAAPPARIEYFHARLDEIDKLLLDQKWFVPEVLFQNNYGMMFFARMSLYAIARASLSGDQPRAMRLLERYLEAARIVNLTNLTGNESYPTDATIIVLSGLAELPDLPSEAWDRAKAALEKSRLSEAEIVDLRRSRAAAYHRLMTQAIADESLSKNGNIWHFFAKGKVESIANRAIAPIAKRQLEQVTMAMSRHDRDGFGDALARFHGTLNAMNVQQYDLPMNFWVERQFSEQVDVELLILAATRARREGTTITLIEAGSPVKLRLEPLPTRRCGYMQIGQDAPAELKKAQQEFWKRNHGNGAIWAEDIEWVLREAGPGDWTKYVQWCIPIHAYAIWSIGRTSAKNLPHPKSEIDLGQVDALKLRMVGVEARLISDEMKRILTKKK
ncbi:MAG: hypothetical protein ABFD69_01930 [Candidatus Sumerlaeia bacterium]